MKDIEYRVLTKTIENPEADRRYKYDWTAAAEWKKGMRLEVISRPSGAAAIARKEGVDASDDDPQFRIREMRTPDKSGSFRDDHPAFELLFRNSRPVAPDWRQVLKDRHLQAEDVVGFLFDAGRLTEADIDVIAEAVLPEDDA